MSYLATIVFKNGTGGGLDTACLPTQPKMPQPYLLSLFLNRRPSLGTTGTKVALVISKTVKPWCRERLVKSRYQRLAGMA